MDGEEVHDPDNSSLVLNTVLHTINNEYEYKSHKEEVMLLNACTICQYNADQFPDNECLIPALSGTKFLVFQV